MSLPMLGVSKAVAGGSPTTIFTTTLATNDSGDANMTFRCVVPITGGAGGGGQVRVTFEASGAASFSCDNVAIGIQSSADVTTATPVELLFSGVSGFTITAGNTLVSDWASLSGFTASDKLIVVLDIAATNGNPKILTSGVPAGAITYYASGDNSYNEATPSPSLGSNALWVVGFNKIEVQ